MFLIFLCIFCPVTWLNIFLSFKSFFGRSFRIFYISNGIIGKQRQFYFFLSDWMSFISLSCLIALARSSSSSPSKRGQSIDTCLFPYLRGWISQLFDVEYDIRCRLSYMPYILFRYIWSYLISWVLFLNDIVLLGSRTGLGVGLELGSEVGTRSSAQIHENTE